MAHRLLLLAVLAAVLVVPVEAMCCAGCHGGGCCETDGQDPAASRCCDEAASFEQSTLSGKSDHPRALAPAPLAQTRGAGPGVLDGRYGGAGPRLLLAPAGPLHALHTVLLI